VSHAYAALLDVRVRVPVAAPAAGGAA